MPLGVVPSWGQVQGSGQAGGGWGVMASPALEGSVLQE